MLNHLKTFIGCMPTLVCQLLVIVALVVAFVCLAVRENRKDTFCLVFESSVKVLIGVAVCYVFAPRKTTGLLGNVITFMTFVVFGAILFKECKSFRNWVTSLDGRMIETEFWYEVLKNPVRLISIIFTLILMSDSILLLAFFIALMAVGGNLMRKRGWLDNIDWSEPSTQKMATTFAVGLAICSILEWLGILGIIFKVLWWAAIVVGFVVAFVLFVKKQ